MISTPSTSSSNSDFHLSVLDSFLIPSISFLSFIMILLLILCQRQCEESQHPDVEHDRTSAAVVMRVNSQAQRENSINYDIVQRFHAANAAVHPTNEYGIFRLIIILTILRLAFKKLHLKYLSIINTLS